MICFVQARLERDALESKLKEDSNRELNASVGVEKDAVVDVEWMCKKSFAEDRKTKWKSGIYQGVQESEIWFYNICVWCFCFVVHLD